MDEATTELRMVRNRLRMVILHIGALLALGGGALGGVAATSDGEPLVGAAITVLFLGCAAWCWLTARSGVLVGEHGVVVRRYLRDRYVPWEEVVSFGLRPHRSKLGERLSRPSLSLRSGEIVWLEGVEPPGRPLGLSQKPVRFEQLDELDQLLRRRQAQRWLRDDPGTD